MSDYSYLLDTNVVSDLIRNPTGIASRHLRTVGEQAVCTSIIVLCELRFGILRRESKRMQQNLAEILESIAVMPFDGDADVHYARVRAALEAEGRPIGANDLLIAAHALSLDLTLVTHNTREFSRVPRLPIEDWLV